jgi:hypothetical protein
LQEGSAGRARQAGSELALSSGMRSLLAHAFLRMPSCASPLEFLALPLTPIAAIAFGSQRLPIRVSRNSTRNTMSDSKDSKEARAKNKDLGVAMALLDRLNNRRLPFAQQLKKKVDQGEVLSDFDMQFLKKVMEDSAEARKIATKLPQFQEIVSKMTTLYNDIMSKGLENQKKAGGGK